MEKYGMCNKKRNILKKLTCIRVNHKKSPLRRLPNSDKISKSSTNEEKRSNGFKIEKMTNKEIEKYVKSL